MLKKENLEQLKQMLSDYRNSGMTSEAWCLSKGIKRSTLYYWMKRLKTKNEDTKWASLPLPNYQGTPGSSSITLRLGEFRLEIESGFEKSVLADVLSVVIQLC